MPVLSRVASLAAVLITVVGLIGWIADLDRLITWVDSPFTLHYMTAAVIAVLAGSTWLSNRRLVSGIALVCFVLVAIAGWLNAVATFVPPRIVPETSISLMACCAALWGVQKRWPSSVVTTLCLIAQSVSYVVGTGYLLQVPAILPEFRSSAMALPTAAALFLLAWSIALSVPGGFETYVWRGDGPRAQLLRRMLPPFAIAFPISGIVTAWAAENSGLGLRQVLVFSVVSATLISVLVLLNVSRSLGQMYNRQRSAVTELAVLNEQLEGGRDEAWRRAEAAAHQLEAEQARFSETMSQLDDMVFTVKLEPDDWELVYCTPRGQGLMGLDVPGEEVLALMTSRVHPDDVRAGRRFFRDVAERRNADVELRVMGMDNVERWVWARARVRQQHGQWYADGIISNIDERRRLQERQQELLAAETDQVRRLKEFAAMREEFMAIAGHELRTPLAAVQGYCELVLDEELSEPVRGFVNIIQNRSAQLNGLVQEFFDLARLNAGSLSLTTGPVNMAELLDEVVDGQRLTARDADLAIVSEVQPVTLTGDALRLRQCVDNLVSNAIKYNRPGGQVLVKGVLSSEEGFEESYVITVRDTGQGMSTNHLPHVFDYFYRADKSDANPIEGTGLGLSVTKALVEAHGGRIEVDSTEGVGTVFTMRLPTTH